MLGNTRYDELLSQIEKQFKEIEKKNDSGFLGNLMCIGGDRGRKSDSLGPLNFQELVQDKVTRNSVDTIQEQQDKIAKELNSQIEKDIFMKGKTPE